MKLQEKLQKERYSHMYVRQKVSLKKNVRQKVVLVVWWEDKNLSYHLPPFYHVSEQFYTSNIVQLELSSHVLIFKQIKPTWYLVSICDQIEDMQ